MQLCVLHRDGELSRQRRQQGRLILREQLALRREDGEQPGDVLPREQRNGDDRLDARLGRRIGHTGEPGVGRDVRDREQAARAVRAKRELEQALSEPGVRAGEADIRGGVQPRVLAEVHGQAILAE